MKYIDANKLIAEIKFAKSVYDNPKRVIFGVADGFRQDGRAAMCDDILKKIASLQQEQPQLPGIEDHGIPGKDFIPVEWVDACEMYGKWKIVKLDQPEVDLEREIKNYLATKCAGDDEPSVSEIARHFAEWGAIHLNVRKE